MRTAHSTGDPYSYIPYRTYRTDGGPSPPPSGGPPLHALGFQRSRHFTATIPIVVCQALPVCFGRQVR